MYNIIHRHDSFHSLAPRSGMSSNETVGANQNLFLRGQQIQMRPWITLMLGAMCACSPEPAAFEKTAADLNPQATLLTENMLTTHATVLAQIKNVVVVEHRDGAALEYQATVTDHFIGSVPRHFRFLQFIHDGGKETPSLPPPLIVSLCLSAEGDFYLPDLGFSFPASEALLATARDGQRPRANASNASACD